VLIHLSRIESVTFTSRNLTVAGTLYTPDNVSPPLPNQARTTEAAGRPAPTTALFPRTEQEAAQVPERSMLHEAWEFYRTPRCEHPNAPSRVAVRSFDELVQFDAWQFLSLIAPRPLLLIAGTDADTRAHSERALDRAADPKELFWVQGATHVDLYGDKPEFREPVVAKLADFFGRHLAPAA
jgi:fermentation-respiration switch protein FrsA (DUF1100 family)